MSIDFDLLLALTRSDDGRLYMNASMIYREQMKIGSIGLISKLWQMRSLWHIFSPSYFLCTGENIISRKGIFVISGIGHFKSIGQAVDIIFHSDWSEMSFFPPPFNIFIKYRFYGPNQEDFLLIFLDWYQLSLYVFMMILKFRGF